MDPIICLETGVKKAQVNKELVMAVFVDVEKAYDMIWKEGLMIKLDMMSITGIIYNWIKDFWLIDLFKSELGKSYLEDIW